MYLRAMLCSSLVTGCYLSGGLGTNDGKGATAHISAGLSLKLTPKARARIGAKLAYGGEERVAGPVALGADVQLKPLRGDRAALSVVADVSLPTGGNWVYGDATLHRSIGRTFAGVGYTFKLNDTFVTPGGGTEKRYAAFVSLSAGPELYWTRDDAELGGTVDVTVALFAWVFGQSLDRED